MSEAPIIIGLGVLLLAFIGALALMAFYAFRVFGR